MFEFFIVLCLASEPDVCRELSRDTADCAAEVRHLKEHLPIKDGPEGEGELVIQALACFPKEKPKLKT